MIRLNNIAANHAVFALTVFALLSPVCAVDMVVRKSDNVTLRGKITSSRCGGDCADADKW